MEPGPGFRLDKWLWHARFFRTRSLAQKMVEAGKVRVNGQRVTKAHAPVRAGDVLTVALPDRVRLVRILAFAERRGPATEAEVLYEEIDPDPAPGPAADPGRFGT